MFLCFTSSLAQKRLTGFQTNPIPSGTWWMTNQAVTRSRFFANSETFRDLAVNPGYT